MRMPPIAKEFLEDFISLIFPKICIHCGTTLVFQEEHICTSCRLSLPKTNFHLLHDNPLKQKFVFSPAVRAVSSFLFFNKGGIAQSLIHELKYRGNKQVGEALGRWYGHELQNAGWNIDVILPVPIHKMKQRRRGYNQCYYFALGLSEALSVPVDHQAVERVKSTKTQTNKSRVDRWLNMQAVYSVNDPAAVTGKRILVVDDVLTTGATIGELVELLVSYGAVNIYIATIAAGK